MAHSWVISLLCCNPSSNPSAVQTGVGGLGGVTACHVIPIVRSALYCTASATYSGPGDDCPGKKRDTGRAFESRSIMAETPRPSLALGGIARAGNSGVSNDR